MLTKSSVQSFLCHFRIVFCKIISNSSSGKASKKVEEEEKLLKLFQGANKNQDGFMQWCEQTLHTLNTANNLDGESLYTSPSTILNIDVCLMCKTCTNNSSH